jgi:hypothetical protein
MKLLTQIEGIDENLTKVKEDIKCKMAESASKINDIAKSNDDSIAHLRDSIQGLEEKLMEKIDTSIGKLLKRQETLFLRMEDTMSQQNSEVAVFKNDASDLIEKVSEVSEKIMDFEKNKRNNLIFYGIPEDPMETPSSLDGKVRPPPPAPTGRWPRCCAPCWGWPGRSA